MIEIDLLRHVSVEGKPALYGVSDVSPSSQDNNKLLTVLTAQQNSESRYDDIISSPLQRCHTIAKAFAQQHQLPLTVVNDFQEMNFGLYDGVPFDDISFGDAPFGEASSANTPFGDASSANTYELSQLALENVADVDLWAVGASAPVGPVTLGVDYAEYEVNDSTSIFLGFHEGFTPTSGGADPEEADNMELGMRYIQGSTFVELVYFDTDYQNMFGSCTASGGAVGECEIGDSFNAGAASISGSELTAQTEIISEAGVTYPISAIYTSTDATFDNTFSSSFWGDVSTGMDIPDLPDSQLAIRGGFRTDAGLSGDATLYSYGSTCSVANCSSGTQIDSYRITDVSLSKQINERVDVYMIVENIFNEEDIIARAPKNGARAQKPRTTFFGLRLKI